MSNLVIKAEHISKQYRLGMVGTGTLSDDINRFWHKIRGKEDPYLQIGETNDRTFKGSSEYVWSLKDINFEIKEGDAVGIIGRNGAGKSTLLKILSKVTQPTTGVIKTKGRIASLLEVGTGFHPELSGRENVFLNGAILGMRKQEIARKFDEIVDFSGVERYIDTPVKRYSSGMYVRLAFAVAAHLESEILIVDEVLAVGDAEFQKKCLGKMGDVNKGGGRTILFVSHNMPAITSLCRSGIILENGRQVFSGPIKQASDIYLATENLNTEKKVVFSGLTDEEKLNGKKAKIISLEILNEKIYYSDTIRINLTVESAIEANDLVVGVGINTLSSVRLMTVENLDNLLSIKPGEPVNVTIELPSVPLAPGGYTLAVGMRQLTYNVALDYLPDVIKFDVETTPSTIHISNNPQLGLRPASNWRYS